MMEAATEKSLVARGWRVALATVSGLLLLLLAIAWIQRRPLVERFVDRELAARGVPGRYRIEAIGVTEQRLADVVLGDPARPDLTAQTVRLRLGWRPTGPYVEAVEARGVRARGRIVDGRLSLGAVDRLLPPPSGKPFSLPGIATDLDDVQLDLATPAGTMRATIAGRGRLDGGFRGRIGISAPLIAASGCRMRDAGGALAAAVSGDAIRLDGPLTAAGATCGAAGVARPRLVVAATLGPALDRWSGSARLSADGAAGAGARLDAVTGTLTFSGVPDRTEGKVMLTAGGAAAGLVAPRIALEARFASGPRLAAEGVIRADGARYPLGDRLAVLDGAAGTPVAPIAAALRRDVAAAARDFDAAARFRYDGALTVDRVRLTSRSGVRGAFDGRLSARPEGVLTLAGGGVPAVRAELARDRARVTVAPMQADEARLAVEPVLVTWGDGDPRIITRVTLDGPVAGGRVTGLSAPVAVVGGRLAGGCLPVALRRLEIAGFDFRDTAARVCPIAGGATIADLALAGRSGDSPAKVELRGVRYAGGQFSMGPVTATIGPSGRQSRLDLAGLSGHVGAQGLAGRFAGAGGSIAAVPILANEGEGGWTLAGGRLALDGALRVSDADPEPRFAPLMARDFRLLLEDGRITAAATLREPVGGVAITNVSIRHDLPAGTGDAVLAVPGVTFTEALQPERLTRLTLGVIANVRGTVSGEGRIRWSPDGVTSDGDFATDQVDLAAAFGPVTGIKGRIHFDDLLALETPPGQEATIAEANPGVSVTDGVVRYQLLPEQRVRIEGGRWPFAGGALLLQPTTVDLSKDERRLSFAVDGLDAGRFIQQLGFENIAATGTFDGVIPMAFDGNGGRIEGGRLVARAGGGTLAYVGELTQAQLGTFGKLAFDALKSIRYRNLTILLDGALDGEIVSRVSFAGVNQEPLEGMKTPFRRQLKGLPFIFNITVRAPFRGLIGSARAFADPTLFIRERLAAPALPGSAPVQPAAPAKPAAPVQPSESDPKP